MAKTTRPIRIYLDTSDYNHLYKESTQYPDERKFLLESVDSDLIEIGYSYPLIFELFRQYDNDHKSDRMQKAEFLRRLCRHNAFPFFSDLKKGHQFPNDGIWMPRDALDIFSPRKIAATFKEKIRSEISTHTELKRSQRRLLKSASGFRLLMDELPLNPLKKQDFQGLPVSQELLNGMYLERYLKGEIPASALSEKLTEWISNPEAFIQIWYEYSGKENHLEPLVDKAYRKLSDNLTKLHKVMADADEAYKAAKKARSQFHDTLRKSGLPPEIKRVVGPLPKIEPVKFELPIQDIDRHFGPGRTHHMVYYLESVIRQKKPLEASDIGDLLHLVYTNDVDLIRCDRRMANLMQDCTKLQSERIVGSLRELPDRIRELMSARDRNA